MEQPIAERMPQDAPQPPTREELNAELLDIDWAPDIVPPVDQPGLETLLARSLSHVRGKRGGDLVGVLLVGSGARRALTQHSDLDLIALVKGQDEGDELVRIGDRYFDIRYRELKAVEQELATSLRLAPLLRKAWVLFEQDGEGASLIEQAQQRFRQGPPPARITERIRLKNECVHWLGKAADLAKHQATALYLFGQFVDSLLEGFFRIRGFWFTAPVETIRFVTSRDAAFGELVEGMLGAGSLEERLEFGRKATALLFKDTPNPPRVD